MTLAKLPHGVQMEGTIVFKKSEKRVVKIRIPLKHHLVISDWKKKGTNFVVEKVSQAQN